MKKIYSFCACVLCALVNVQAANVSPEQARKVAAQFMTEKNQARLEQGKPIRRQVPTAKELSAEVLFNATNVKGQPYVYTVRFPEQEGFVLVSGDDRFASVLGYSECDTWNEQNIPNHMRAWLQEYIDEMKWLESKGYEPTASQQALTDKAPIEPLINTRWNQRAPYNNICPIDNQTGQLSLTGCVATGMAQVLNYHMQRQHRPTAVIADIPAYTTRSNEMEVPGIPAGTVLPNIANLKDIYDANATAADCTAVAQLMLYCGVSLEMDYTSDGSGAYTSDISYCLVEYFGFDRTSQCVQRGHYSYAQWIDLIYAELAAARPVAYGGKSSGGGHSFVVDGFEAGDFFHINWGWGGSYDGYYALSVLKAGDSMQPGASSSRDGYSYGQVANIGCQIVGAQPENECLCLTTTIYKIEDQEISYKGKNYTDTVCAFDYGIGIMEEDGSLILLGSKKTSKVLDYGSGVSNVSRTVPTNMTYANMTKKIVPISRMTGTTTWCTSPTAVFNYAQATYDAEGIPHLTLHPIVDLVSNDLSVRSEKFVNLKQEVALTVTNNGDEFYGVMYLFASMTTEKGEPVISRGMTIFANSTQEIFFDWTPKETGTYNLWVGLDEDGVEILDSTVVTITNDPALQDKILAITGITFDGIDANSRVIDPVTGVREVDVYADRLVGKLYVRNFTDSVFNDTVCVYYDRFDGQDFVKASKYTYYTKPFEPDQERSYNVNRTEEQVPTNNTYRIRISTKNATKYSGFIDRDMHYIIHMYPAAEGIEELKVQPSADTQKVLHDGRILILRGEHIYDIMGRKVTGKGER